MDNIIAEHFKTAETAKLFLSFASRPSFSYDPHTKTLFFYDEIVYKHESKCFDFDGWIDLPVDGHGLYQNNRQEGLWIYHGIIIPTKILLFYHNGRKEGPYLRIYPNGQLEVIGHFKNDWKNGEWNYWSENGKLIKRIIYQDNENIKTIEKFQVMGHPGYELLHYQNGKREGPYIFHQDNFTQEGQYLNDKKNGIWKRTYQKTGELIIDHYQNDKLISSKTTTIFRNKVFSSFFGS